MSAYHVPESTRLVSLLHFSQKSCKQRVTEVDCKSFDKVYVIIDMGVSKHSVQDIFSTIFITNTSDSKEKSLIHSTCFELMSVSTSTKFGGN